MIDTAFLRSVVEGMVKTRLPKEEGTDEEETMDAMSLHKLIKKLDPKKKFRVEYENKKSHDCTKLVFNGTYKII